MINSNTLTVCIDFKNPEAYLAWAPTCALARKQNIAINWLPFVGPHPKIPETPQANQKPNRGTLHRHMRFEYRQQNIMRYSAKLGLTREALNRKINSEPAALGLLWCQQISNTCTIRYIETMFTACWQQKLDIADPALIQNAIESANAKVEHFAPWVRDSGSSELADLHHELKQQGVFDSPFYLLQGESFLGRQHLPMIEWMLSNKQGIKPI